MTIKLKHFWVVKEPAIADEPWGFLWLEVSEFITFN